MASATVAQAISVHQRMAQGWSLNRWSSGRFPLSSKEQKNDLEIDRTSCRSFAANAFRVLQTAAAYALFQELRWRMKRSELRRAQIGALRLRLLKIGVRVVVSVHRVVVHSSRHWPWLGDWLQAARAVGAVPV